MERMGAIFEGVDGGKRNRLGTTAIALALGLSAAAPARAQPDAAADGRSLERLRGTALEYSAHLPNFICTQVTRRSSGRGGSGVWRDLDEVTQSITFYDGREHYRVLKTRRLSGAGESFQPWMNSIGEFGSLLRQIFGPESGAGFTRASDVEIRGRKVERLFYTVDLKHSKYEIWWRESGAPKGVVDAYSGLLYVDPERLVILRLTLDAQPLPEPFPVRSLSLTLDYDDAQVAGKAYNLPLSFTMTVDLQNGRAIRNQAAFRDYRRFAASSRVIAGDAK